MTPVESTRQAQVTPLTGSRRRRRILQRLRRFFLPFSRWGIGIRGRGGVGRALRTDPTTDVGETDQNQQPAVDEGRCYS